MINEFKGEYSWLSNFFECPVTYGTHTYRSVEHAYQSLKAVRGDDQNWVANAKTPGMAKQRGRTIEMVPDWDKNKRQVMALLLISKFADPVMRAKLLATGLEPLVEGNTWGDRYWGTVEGEGHNYLGRLLMDVRKLFQTVYE